MELTVRELRLEDIDLLTAYWMDSTPEYLKSMGVDLSAMPSREEFREMIQHQLSLPLEQRKSYALCWCADNVPVGHSNLTDIKFGQEAKMHLHIWDAKHRYKGMGSSFLRKSIPFYFKNLKLKNLYCEPFANNPTPHATLRKLGFKKIDEYRTVPGSINFEQEVKRWHLSKVDYQLQYI